MRFKILVSLILCFCIAFYCCDTFAATADSVSVYSPSMKKQVPCMVIRPSTYNRPKERFNVVYLLHGYSGNHRQWLNDAPQLLELADRYQFMIVCPDGGFSSWYFDSPRDSTMRYEISGLFPINGKSKKGLVIRHAVKRTGTNTA
jgi:pimeloyl-ACP methyl ester carboxylesterase